MTVRTEGACLRAALEYLERGWSPIPLCSHDHQGVGRHGKDAECQKPGKVPLFQWKVHQERRASEAEVRLWWNRWPGANVGVVLGRVSNLIGVDADGPEAWALLLEVSEGREWPPTLTFDTPGGGVRYLYRLPAGAEPAASYTLRRGQSHVIVLGEGSYTVMPPSIHACGKEYG